MYELLLLRRMTRLQHVLSCFLLLYDIILLLLFYFTIPAIEMLIYNKNITGAYSEATL